jgi:hypothetical protein
LSQIYKNLSGGGTLPPNVPTTFTEDSGTAVPAANNLNIVGGTSTANVANGIQTVGSGSTVTINLTNRVVTPVPITTVGAVTTPLITLPLGGVPGTYGFNIRVVGFNAATPASTTYFEFVCAATTGAAARIVSAGDSDEICLEDATLNASDVLITAVGNSVVVSAQGVAGLTIDWNADGLYTFVS